LGDSEALNNLGLLLENGFDDRPSDPESALEIYRQAHKLGNADAVINIALYYIRGKQPVEMDIKKGKEILK
jgi:TPR repeat protein